MKKFMKSCAITALVLLILGFSLAIIAGSVRGKAAIKEVVEAVTGGRIHVNLEGGENWGIYVDEKALFGIKNGFVYNIEDSMIFDSNFEIFKGNVGKYSVGSDVRALDIEVGGCEFRVKSSGDDNFYVEAINTNKFQGFVKGQILYVKGTMSTGLLDDFGDCKITLYVPDGYYFDSVEAELGAGMIELDSLKSRETRLDVDAGQIIISSVQSDKLRLAIGMGEILLADMEVQNLEAEVDMGHLHAEGSILGDATIECDMGSIEMVIKGAWEDFDYNLECGMGNLVVGDDSFSGLSNEKKVNNGTGKSMNVECNMGNMEITFTE